MICWGLGAFGLGLTGAARDQHQGGHGRARGARSCCGARTSRASPTPHATSWRRGDAARTSSRSTCVAPKPPRSPTKRSCSARAATPRWRSAMMHVIIGERLHDRDFVARHTVGFEALATHVEAHPPRWAAPVTGIAAERIVGLARRYATTKPAMIVLGGSSMHKGSNGWQGARAIGCLPALTGNLGVPGGGFGPRHGSRRHGQALNNILAARPPPARPLHPEPDAARHGGAGRRAACACMLLFGTDMLSSYADASSVAKGLARTDFVVELRPVPERYRTPLRRRRPAGDRWLEELGCKSTNTHLYLMPKILAPPGETRSGARGCCASWRAGSASRLLSLGERRGSARRDARSSGHRPRDRGGAARGGRHPRAEHLACSPPRSPLPDAVGQDRALLRARARASGCRRLPISRRPAGVPAYTLRSRQGRTLDPVPRLLRPWPRAADARRGRSRAALWISPDGRRARAA